MANEAHTGNEEGAGGWSAVSFRYHRSHRDKSHKPIQDAFKACGFSVVDVSAVGGFVDMIVGRRKLSHLIECKTRKGEGGAVRTGKVRDEQQEFHDVWRGSPIIVAYNFEEAYAKVLQREKEVFDYA